MMVNSGMGTIDGFDDGNRDKKGRKILKFWVRFKSKAEAEPVMKAVEAAYRAKRQWHKHGDYLPLRSEPDGEYVLQCKGISGYVRCHHEGGLESNLHFEVGTRIKVKCEYFFWHWAEEDKRGVSAKMVACKLYKPLEQGDEAPSAVQAPTQNDEAEVDATMTCQQVSAGCIPL